MGIDDRARGKCDRSPHHREHRLGPSVYLLVYDVHKLSHEVLQPDARPEPGLRLKKHGPGQAVHVNLLSVRGPAAVCRQAARRSDGSGSALSCGAVRWLPIWASSQAVARSCSA